MKSVFKIYELENAHSAGKRDQHILREITEPTEPNFTTYADAKTWLTINRLQGKQLVILEVFQ